MTSAKTRLYPRPISLRGGEANLTRMTGGEESDPQEPVTGVRLAKNLAALRMVGIGRNGRVQRIRRLPHVTPAYIRTKALCLSEEKRRSTDLLHFIESGDPLPGKQGQDPDDRHRYIRGKYAGFIAVGLVPIYLTWATLTKSWRRILFW